MEQRFLGEILHRRAGIPLDRLEAMYAIQREKGIALADLLVNGNVVDDATIAKALAAEAELPFADRVDPERISTALATRVPITFAKNRAGKMIITAEDDGTVFVVVPAAITVGVTVVPRAGSPRDDSARTAWARPTVAFTPFSGSSPA